MGFDVYSFLSLQINPPTRPVSGSGMGRTIGIVQVRFSGCGLVELPLKADSRVLFPCGAVPVLTRPAN